MGVFTVVRRHAFGTAASVSIRSFEAHVPEFWNTEPLLSARDRFERERARRKAVIDATSPVALEVA